MSELEKDIREMLSKYSPTKIIHKDFSFREKTIYNVPHEILEGYGEVINFNTAYHIELILHFMYKNNIDDIEYREQ